MCHKCLGSGKINGEECSECHGKKYIPQKRCQNSMMIKEGRAGFKAYRLFKEYQQLPVLAGILEQTQYFLNILELCDTVNNVLTKEKVETAKLLRKMGNKNVNRSTNRRTI